MLPCYLRCAVAKRSPILGYNHNVLYRGLVFHLQTEDSGQASPHLFTHLFHGGVIISTRKLVYDAGSAEDAIKGLMQAQHKVVLKDLKKGTFDDKIDSYLAGTEGLLPRSPAPAVADASAVMAPVRTADVLAPPEGRMSEPLITMRPATEELESLDALDPVEVLENRPSEPQLLIEEAAAGHSRAATPPPPPRGAAPAVARTKTAERKSAPSAVRPNLGTAQPVPDELDPPTDPEIGSGAISATVRTPMVRAESGPEISINLDLEDPDSDQPGVARTRSRHDTDVESDGVPGSIGAASRRPGDSVAPPIGQERRPTGDRQTALGAAALPPARPISRPPSRPAIAPPTVMSRQMAPEARSDAVEVYAPAPPSADAPPGERSERPGQYAQHKRPTGKIPIDALKSNDRSGAIPIPSGLSRPGRSSVPVPSSGTVPPVGSSGAPSSQPFAPRAATASSQPIPQAPRSASPSQSHPVPGMQSPSPPPEGIARARTTTPSRVSPGSGPSQPRVGSQSGGVVMTRPAVIVGAPAKPAPPRVRKAREEEGRGFGQGLISEKSLDEVILAYLSEDADEK